MQLTPNFSMEEFTETSHREFDNTLPPELMSNALRTCYMMENIRSYLAVQALRPIRIFVTSGYRSQLVNRAVGSDDSSDHRRADAADFKAPDFGEPFLVATALKSVVDELGIGQLIFEYGRWIHVSPVPRKNPVNRIISIWGKKDIRVGIVRQ